jgi:hypothetical protein
MPRSTIEFSPAADKQLEDLTITLGASSKAEIVRNALSLYAYLAADLAVPNRALGIIATDRNNSIERVIVVPGLSPVSMPTPTPAYR